MPSNIKPGIKDNRIDLYIEKSAEFAVPVLRHIRKLIHTACPQTMETIKWGFPHFDYKEEMLCSMAAFKHHCAFTFRKAALMTKNKKLELTERSAMGHLGKIKSISDLPSEKEFISMIKEAMELNDKGIKLKKIPAADKSNNKELILPDYFSKVLSKNKAAKDAFTSFSNSHKREYMEWITEAKTETTREKRIAATMEWLSQGKSRNWKYIKTKNPNV